MDGKSTEKKNGEKGRDGAKGFVRCKSARRQTSMSSSDDGVQTSPENTSGEDLESGTERGGQLHMLLVSIVFALVSFAIVSIVVDGVATVFGVVFGIDVVDGVATVVGVVVSVVVDGVAIVVGVCIVVDGVVFDLFGGSGFFAVIV